MRNLVLVLGDQLNHDSAAFQGFDPAFDVVWMAEVAEEATHVWSHKLRTAFFFSAMRHFRDELEGKGRPVHYHELTADETEDRGRSFAEVLRQSVRELQPHKLVMVLPGDYRVLRSLRTEAGDLGLEIEFRPDIHFYRDPPELTGYGKGAKRLLLDNFYRDMRRTHRVLLHEDGSPVGGRWNFDAENRLSLKSRGAVDIPSLPGFPPDQITLDVITLVRSRFARHPGRLEHFDLPVTRGQALSLLDSFIVDRLARFGPYEDAMLADQPFLFHSRLSSSLNTRLLDPRECVDAAAKALAESRAPLNSVEGFIRQLLGWREYMRGIYWTRMPDYAAMNFFGHELNAPAFFWDGETDMECARQTMQHVLNHGYSHHIHRLMVMGNFAMMFGVHPLKFHNWHMAMYCDAVDWVSLPNALGMSQYGDGGIAGTKPYCSTGRYINRMSDFCERCRYDPELSVGETACPFTTLYWEFLDRHHDRLKGNPRMGLQLRNLEKARADAGWLNDIRVRTDALRKAISPGKN